MKQYSFYQFSLNMSRKVYAMAGGITGLASLWTMVFIGYDRYNVIVGGFSTTPVSKLKEIFTQTRHIKIMIMTRFSFFGPCVTTAEGAGLHTFCMGLLNPCTSLAFCRSMGKILSRGKLKSP